MQASLYKDSTVLKTLQQIFNSRQAEEGSKSRQVDDVKGNSGREKG